MNISVLQNASNRKNVAWVVVTAGMVIALSVAISEQKWLYFFIFLLPGIIYISMAKPFIFPFGLYVFLLPFDSVLSISGEAQGTSLTKVLGILSICVLFLKGVLEKKIKKPDEIIIGWCLFIGYGILTVLWAVEPDKVWSKIPTAVGLLLLYVSVSTYRIQRNEYNNLKWMILAGALVAALYVTYFYEQGKYYSLTARASLMYEDRSTDPNYYAFTLLVPLSICIQMIMDQRKKIAKVFLWICFGVIVFSIIISGSRGGIFGVGIIYAVYLFSMQKKISMGSILIIFGIIMSLFIPDLFYERWKTAFDAEQGGGGRLSIWLAGLEAIKKFWLFGAGLNNFPSAYDSIIDQTPYFKGEGRASHNIYLGLMVEVGIAGFALLVWGFWNHYQAAKIKSRLINDKNNIMLTASFWGILAVSLFIDTLWSKSFWLLLMMILMNKSIVQGESRRVYP